MKRTNLFILALAFACSVQAQSSAQRVTATTGGSYTSAQFSADYTVGEVFITTLSAAGLSASQGFHQVSDIPSQIIELNDVSQWQLWPNPANDFVNLSSNNISIQSVELFDAMGKLVASHSQTNRFAVSDLPSGIYTLRVHSNARVEEHRLTVVH
jgi:hypothetical protein